MCIFNVMNQRPPDAWGFNVDIVMCIDATGSMAPILDEVKRAALTFGQLFKEAMDSKGTPVEQLRAKAIAFRDCSIDSVPLLESGFFVLPAEQTRFKQFLDGIEAGGDGDGLENALEALAAALNSDWVTTGARRRHVVLLFTGTSAPLTEERSACGGYPANFLKRFQELGDWWAGFSQYFSSNYNARSGRMVVFAPRKEPWIMMELIWNYCFHVPYPEQCDLSDSTMKKLSSLLVDYDL